MTVTVVEIRSGVRSIPFGSPSQAGLGPGGAGPPSLRIGPITVLLLRCLHLSRDVPLPDVRPLPAVQRRPRTPWPLGVVYLPPPRSREMRWRSRSGRPSPRPFACGAPTAVTGGHRHRPHLHESDVFLWCSRHDWVSGCLPRPHFVPPGKPPSLRWRRRTDLEGRLTSF